MHCKGKFSREEGFLGGPTMQIKWGSESFLGKCLKNVRFIKIHCFSKFNPGCNGRWEDFLKMGL